MTSVIDPYFEATAPLHNVVKQELNISETPLIRQRFFTFLCKYECDTYFFTFLKFLLIELIYGSHHKKK